MASYLVLLGTPRELHIPYFAVGVPRSYDTRIEPLDLATDLARLVGRRCAAWINARSDLEGIELITTRNYLPPQTTFHATWLLFREQAVAAEFLEAYPQHRLDGRMAKLEADYDVLSAKLRDWLKRGDFDLGRIGNGRQRDNLARRYVEAAEALRSFGSELRLLERARMNQNQRRSRAGRSDARSRPAWRVQHRGSPQGMERRRNSRPAVPIRLLPLP